MRPVADSLGADALLAQAPLPAVERGPGAADRLQGGLRRKFVADRVEAVKFPVRTFGLHGAFSRLSAVGFLLSTMLPQKFSRARLLPKDAVRREEAGSPACI